MLYSIGHEENYLANFKTYKGKVEKAKGGYAFKTLRDARLRIREEKKVGVWAVFGLKASWTKDTYKDPEGWWHLLNKKAPLKILRRTK